MAKGLSKYLDSEFGGIQGNILYRGASGWAVLAPGVAGQHLQTNGSGFDPTWVTPATGGGGGGGSLPSTANIFPGSSLGVLPDGSANWLTPSGMVAMPWSGLYGQIGQIAVQGSGAVGQVTGAGTCPIPIALELVTGTTTIGAAGSYGRGISSVGNSRGALLTTQFSAFYVEQMVSIPILSATGDVFECILGLVQPTSLALAPSNGVYMSIIGSTMYLSARSAVTLTQASGTFTITAGVAYRVRVIWITATQTAYLYVDGTLIATLTSGIPAAGTSYTVEPLVRITKSSGTTSRTFYFGTGSFVGFLA